MTTAAPIIEPDVVHEALDERQFVRTRFPAKATVHAREGNIICNVVDLSLGGMGLATDVRLKVGSVYPAHISFKLRDMTLSLEGRVKVVAHRPETTGVEFVDMTPGQRDVIRHIVSAYLSGELVQSNGILTVMQRENSVRQRKQKADNTRTFGDRVRAVAGTLAYLLAGFLVLALLLYQLYLFFFRTEAITARVEGDVFEVNMPENGMVSFLLPADQQTVRTGEPIAVVSTRLLASLNTAADLDALGRLSDGETQMLLGRSMIETVISSPCDCQIIYPAPPRDRYGYKDESLIHLLPEEAPLHVAAQFPFSALDKINGDDHVEMEVFGIADKITGRIIDSAVDPETSNLSLTIAPDQFLPVSAYHSPARVQVFSGMPELPKLPLMAEMELTRP